ncbi:EamA family transporter [Castellaniella caeni]|uniref:EamA family transporter n=1 Tax=Castellaniella caeni TaxID=266123 RepID=UPI00082B365D|nr:EamA family transporter [Castellaniella caeni]
MSQTDAAPASQAARRAAADTAPPLAAGTIRAVRGGGRWLAVAMAVASMTSVQVGVSLAVPVIHDYGPLSTSSLRLCWAAVLLCLFVRPPLHRFSAAQWRAALVLGAAMAAMSLAFFVAIARLSQHLTVALEFCGPLLVAALGVRGWRALAWPLMAAVGIVLLVWGDAQASHGADPVGIAYALLAAAGWGVYIVMMKKVGHGFPGLQGLAVSLLAAAVLSLPFAVLETGPALFPWWQLLLTAGLAILVPLVPYVLEILALRRLPAAAFGVLMSLEPAIGAVSGWLILGQGMALGQMLGVALVVAASVGVIRAGLSIPPR